MNPFVLLVARDLKLAWREGGAVFTALGFYLAVVAMLPFGLGPDLNLLSRIAPGVLWVALLLSALLSVDRIFHNDFEDGALEPMAGGPLPLELVAAAKSLAHWLSTGLPLVLAAPLLGLLLNLPSEAYGMLMLTMLVGTPAVSFIGSIGAALTLGLRRGGLLLSLLILPLQVPVLIFAVSAVTVSVTGPGSPLPALAILAALSLASMVLAPLAAAAAIRMNLQ
ncbi:MAG: heme exporter protein CcmB [Pseudomonadota bacterium]|nr:heme exporter protein CcmB [Pseudomonadota bacterium]